MPIVEEVAAAYKDKGVVLYAVNQEKQEYAPQLALARAGTQWRTVSGLSCWWR